MRSCRRAGPRPRAAGPGRPPGRPADPSPEPPHAADPCRGCRPAGRSATRSPSPPGPPSSRARGSPRRAGPRRPGRAPAPRGPSPPTWAAGVGRVEVRESGLTEPGDVAPGGLSADEIGERRDTAARRMVRRAAPDRPPRSEETDPSAPGLALVVVAPRDGLGAYAPDPLPAEDWMACGVPHLYAGVVEATGVVGPLVLPGGTACASCLEAGRSARDPARSLLLAQWRSGRRRTVPPACDIALATTVAGLAACHALSFLDGDLPGSAGARWEVTLPGVRWRSERITPHPECPCGASGVNRGKRVPGGDDGRRTPAESKGNHASGIPAAHETMSG
ncbi:ThiF family adenylyltransferase [Streptomyces sp. t39]|nr:ThiF family adenylyltransferase [Streptomyces sp. t39]